MQYDDGEDIELNQWFQKASWNNKRFINYKGEWGSGWKYSDEGKVKVVGLSHGNRAMDFLYVAREKDFKMFLEGEPDNPVNNSARKVMASAKIDGKSIAYHIGYLPDDVANKYSGVDIDIRPSSAFLPESTEFNLGLQVVLLVRSARYLKAQEKELQSVANEPSHGEVPQPE